MTLLLKFYIIKCLVFTVMNLVLAFLLLCINACLSKKCAEKTFDNIYVLVVEGANSENFQIVSGCISNRTIRYQNLKSLKITRQDIMVLKTGAVTNIPDRFNVNFNKNNLTSIDQEAFFNLPGLVSIELGHNGIEWIEQGAFANLPALNSLNLENNKLEILLHNTFVNLPNLTIISLDANKLQTFHQDWFYKTPKLTYLFLNENAIRSLPKSAFASLSSLEGISLTTNKISYVHKQAFLGLEKLIEIDLGENLITSLDFDFKTVPNLSFLGIHQNRLNFVTDSSLKSMQNSLKSIWVYLNPWQCSCLDKLLQWGMNQTIRVQWQCKNTALTCIIPEDDGNCTGPLSNEFLLEKQKYFTSSECVKKFIRS